MLEQNRGMYDLYGNLYKGGLWLIKPPAGAIHPITREPIVSYLEQHEEESDGDYNIRLRNSFSLPYCKEIVSVFSSTVFRQDVTRDALSDYFPRDYIADIDLRGHSAREFLRRAFTLAEVYGWVGCLTDYPRQSGAWLSRYHQQQAQERPYSRIILPSRLWDWQVDPGTGNFVEALIWNGVDGEGCRFREWFPGEWQDLDGQGTRIDGGPNGLGRVPLDILTCGSVEPEDGFEPFGWSALSDVAGVCLHMYQIISELEAHERLTLFAFLHLKADADDYKGDSRPAAPDIHLGSRHYLWNPGDVSWVEPPASLPKEAREQISWCIQEMRRATGVATRSEESLEAHSGVALAWEYSSRHNQVYERAQNLEDFESRLWRTHGDWLGIDVPLDAIRYPREYAVQPIESELSELKSLSEIATAWPETSSALLPLVRQKLRRIAIRDVGHLPEIDNVLDAIGAIEPEESSLASATGLPGGNPPAAGEAPPSPELAMAEAEQAALDGDLALVEQLVKSKAPDEMVRAVMRRIAGRAGIATPEVLTALSSAEFRWYTEVQAEIAATGETAEELPEAGA